MKTAFRRNISIVAVVLFITMLPMLYGNMVARKGGILDDSILNTQDFYYMMDQKVRALAREGIKTDDAISFVIPFESTVTRADLAYIQFFTDALKKAFPENSVLSLSVIPQYHDTGEELRNKPYIHEELLREMAPGGAAGIDAWKDAIRTDPGVYGLLIGRSFDYAVVLMMMPAGHNEVTTFKKTAEFLEQRTISDFEWYRKTDIYPAQVFKRVYPAGWLIARGLTDAALVADTLKLAFIGLLITGCAFFLSFISWRQALAACVVVAICFFWARGSLGICQALGLKMYERVYFLIVYTSIIVAGISFVERKFDSYNEARREHPEADPPPIWRMTRPVNKVIGITACIAILNFATLYQIGVRGILEVGVFSSLGILFLLILVFWFVPALHMLIGGETAAPSGAFFIKAGYVWNRFLQKTVDACYRIAVPGAEGSSYKKSALLSLSLIAATLVCALTLLYMDNTVLAEDDFKFIHIRTRPLEFIEKTIADKAREILNRPGNNGFERLPVLVMPRRRIEGGAVYDPRFIQRAAELSGRIRQIGHVRAVTSVLNTVAVISRESYKTDLPVESQQLSDILRTIEWDLGPTIKEQLWFQDGIVLFAFGAADDSNKAAAVRDGIVDLAEKAFPDLEVLPFGKGAMYPSIDQYIREGKPLNVITSQWIVFAVFSLWILWRNRKAASAQRLRPFRTGLVMNAPFVFAGSVIVLAMAVLRVPLDQATAVITALAINAAVDFGLYLVADYQTALRQGMDIRRSLEYALPEKGKMIVVDILLNMLCFAPLMTSTFIPVSRLGWVMILMLLSCGFGALVLMPALLPWCVKSRPMTD